MWLLSAVWLHSKFKTSNCTFKFYLNDCKSKGINLHLNTNFCKLKVQYTQNMVKNPKDMIFGDI